MAPLDPWIIEQIKKREREQEEERRREQPTVPADDPREMPEQPVDRQPNPGYEMPNPNDPKREERPAKTEESDRGVTVIDIGGGGDECEKSPAIDINKLPEIQEGDEESDKQPE